MNAQILALRSRAERNMPRWMACRSMMSDQTSTKFTNVLEVVGEVDSARGVRRLPVADLDTLVRGVVDHHLVQVLVGVVKNEGSARNS